MTNQKPIVTMMPTRFRFSWMHAVIIGACFAGPGLVAAHQSTDEGKYISHEEARQEVFEAYDGYPDIREARQVQVVGINCGPGSKELLVRESEEFPVSYILDNCQNIEVR
jgi:hypothetical protein